MSKRPRWHDPDAFRARAERQERRDEMRREYERQLRWQHTLYDALKKAADESAHALFIWTLHHGTVAQVESSISRFFRTSEGRQHSLAYMDLCARDLEEMKTAMEEYKVPMERCFFENEELDKENSSGDKPNIENYWNAADGLKVRVARLAWLMKYEEDDADFTCVANDEV